MVFGFMNFSSVAKAGEPSRAGGAGPGEDPQLRMEWSEVPFLLPGLQREPGQLSDCLTRACLYMASEVNPT